MSRKKNLGQNDSNLDSRWDSSNDDAEFNNESGEFVDLEKTDVLDLNSLHQPEKKTESSTPVKKRASRKKAKSSSKKKTTKPQSFDNAPDGETEVVSEDRFLKHPSSITGEDKPKAKTVHKTTPNASSMQSTIIQPTSEPDDQFLSYAKESEKACSKSSLLSENPNIYQSAVPVPMDLLVKQWNTMEAACNRIHEALEKAYDRKESDINPNPGNPELENRQSLSPRPSPISQKLAVGTSAFALLLSIISFALSQNLRNYITQNQQANASLHSPHNTNPANANTVATRDNNIHSSRPIKSSTIEAKDRRENNNGSAILKNRRRGRYKR